VPTAAARMRGPFLYHPINVAARLRPGDNELSQLKLERDVELSSRCYIGCHHAGEVVVGLPGRDRRVPPACYGLLHELVVHGRIVSETAHACPARRYT